MTNADVTKDQILTGSNVFTKAGIRSIEIVDDLTIKVNVRTRNDADQNYDIDIVVKYDYGSDGYVVTGTKASDDGAVDSKTIGDDGYGGIYTDMLLNYVREVVHTHNVQSFCNR